MKLATLRTFDNYISANLTLAKLQDNGVECFLENENTATIIPIYSNIIGGIKLMVKEENLQLAKEVLKIMDDEYLAAAVCPNCKQKGLATKYKLGPKGFSVFLLSLFSAPINYHEQIYHCNKCGWESKTLPEFNAEETRDADKAQ